MTKLIKNVLGGVKLLTCCHPALNNQAQVALTLKTLCGLTSREIARAYLVSETTMQQRLVRAKKKIRDAVQSNVSFDQLEKIRLLGEGEYGEVWVVAADVFDAVFGGEAQVFVEAMTNVVAVKVDGHPA